ncbi:unnamed protein product [Rodentolepis nana]|uniref:Uncharacterized protein n=1 Tax=Rodentolepis nana TaxID=102285 RepID=A0A0R3TPW9_RODNA|nr:unnamed protein product [Rodentolepis nana]
MLLPGTSSSIMRPTNSRPGGIYSPSSLMGPFTPPNTQRQPFTATSTTTRPLTNIFNPFSPFTNSSKRLPCGLMDLLVQQRPLTQRGNNNANVSKSTVNQVRLFLFF